MPRGRPSKFADLYSTIDSLPPGGSIKIPDKAVTNIRQRVRKQGFKLNRTENGYFVVRPNGGNGHQIDEAPAKSKLGKANDAPAYTLDGRLPVTSLAFKSKLNGQGFDLEEVRKEVQGFIGWLSGI